MTITDLSFFFCHMHGMKKFLGQASNPCHSYDLCHSCSKARFLTRCATWELPILLFLTLNKTNRCLIRPPFHMHSLLHRAFSSCPQGHPPVSDLPEGHTGSLGLPSLSPDSPGTSCCSSLLYPMPLRLGQCITRLGWR